MRTLLWQAAQVCPELEMSRIRIWIAAFAADFVRRDKRGGSGSALASGGVRGHAGRMIAAERTCLVLLAAGLSTRFGPEDKLAQRVGDRQLAQHAAETLATIPFLARFAVVGEGSTFEGYRVVVNPRPENGQSGSLRLGVETARALAPDAILVALADMPLVTAGLIERLLAAADGAAAIVASHDGERPQPPALFGAAHFAALLEASGDQGARDLIRTGRFVHADPRELIDVDTPADLEALRNR